MLKVAKVLFAVVVTLTMTAHRLGAAGKPDFSGTWTLASGTTTASDAIGPELVIGEAHWSLRSVVVGGREVFDLPVEIGAADVAGGVATFTDLHSELSGTLQSASGIPAPEYDVVMLPSSPAMWLRRVQSTRPATDGRFAFYDLPAGDYLLAALTDVEPADLADTAFLESLAKAALPVHLAEGETKVQSLRISR